MFAYRFTLFALLLALVAHAASDKDAPIPPPIELGEMAYTGGAFTFDGQHFVYAVLPRDPAQGSELRAADTKTGKVESLGFVPLFKQQPVNADYFRWSIGVFAADNNLEVVYIAQFGPEEDLSSKTAVAWSMKEKKVLAAKHFPDLEALRKERSAAPVGVKLNLTDLDADAAKQRKQYVPVEDVPKLLGKKQLTIQLSTGGKEIQIDATGAFRDLYATAVADYPKSRMQMDSGKVLVNDSIEAVAQCGKWLIVRCGFYAHYGIHGRGYDRLALVNVEAPSMAAYPGIGSHSASGVRTGPIDTAFIRSPDGKCVAGMSNGRVTLYRLPE
ncbi:MAG TPA: hypothetical protein VGP72_08180 [Planctomycetota bacterium]